MADQRAIGVFDSGIGGLTVVAEIFNTSPRERVIYFGDTARLPYGTKSPETVRKFALQITRFLLRFPIKMVVVACNTASAEALDVLQKTFDLPIIGVVEPGARAGVANTHKQRIGVIGTTGTIGSGAYQRAIMRQKSQITVFAQSCPLFVPLVEEGWTDDDVTHQVARRYLTHLVQDDIDTLILGCTHYPLLKPVIQETVGSDILLVDSATETAHEVAATLQKLGLETDAVDLPEHRYFVSDYSAHFQKIGEQCLRRKLTELTRVDLDEMDDDAQCAPES